MIIGSTPTYTFTLPPLAVEVAEVKVTFAQGAVSVSKKLDECQMVDNVLSLKLTQEDTLNFSEGVVEIQIKVLITEDDDSNVLVSEPMYDQATRCLDEEVLE